MKATVERFILPSQVFLIEPLIREFHKRVHGLPYPIAWTQATLPQAVQSPRTLLLVGSNGNGKYLGYAWAEISPDRSCYVYQALSLSPAVGKAIDEKLEQFCREVGVKEIHGLVVLQPGEMTRILEVIPRIYRMCSRFGVSPQYIWLTKRIKEGM